MKVSREVDTQAASAAAVQGGHHLVAQDALTEEHELVHVADQRRAAADAAIGEDAIATINRMVRPDTKENACGRPAETAFLAVSGVRAVMSATFGYSSGKHAD